MTAVIDIISVILLIGIFVCDFIVIGLAALIYVEAQKINS